MKRVVVVGDPHATASELDDCWKLINCIEGAVRKERADTVLLLGDLYHTHAMMHVEVMSFWRRAFQQLTAAGAIVKVLVGNHDMPGNDASTSNALLAHVDAENVHVLAAPCAQDGIAFVPYCASAEDFIAKAQLFPEAKTLICHQTFDGSVFENGMYAPHGADSSLVPQELVISGHIHKPQSFGKVWYPGAPRWRTLSDANVKRDIWLVEFDEDGRVIEKTPHSTGFRGGGCREIRSLSFSGDSGPRPGRTDDLTNLWDHITGPVEFSPTRGLEPTIDWRVELKGRADFVEIAKRLLQAEPSVKLRTVAKSEERSTRVKESDGIPVAFRKYIRGFRGAHKTNPDTLEKLAMERLGWA